MLNLIVAQLRQSTTGGGFAALLAALTAYSTGQITGQQLIVGIAGAAVLIIWPQSNSALQGAVKTTVTDLEALIPQLVTAYKAGLTHNAALVAQPPPNPAGGTAQAADMPPVPLAPKAA